MKKVFLLALAAALLCGCMKDFDEDIHSSYNEMVFSNKNIEEALIRNKELKDYCLDSLDINHDGIIAEDEISGVLRIDCSGRGMTSLEGIEIFPCLTTLICSNNCLESLNLSQTNVKALFANPMNDSSGKNLLKYVYVRRDQEIEYVTSDRDAVTPSRIPSETIVISVPAVKDGE